MAEPYHLRLEIPAVPELNSAGYRHWRVRQKERNAWYEWVRWGVLGAWAGEYGEWSEYPAPKSGRARLRLTRCTAGRGPDYDNLVQSFKHIIDGLVKCGLLLDDTPAVIGQPEYRWEKVKRGEAHVIVEVFEEETDG